MDKKDQLPLKWCLSQTHLLGADLLSSITHSERIKIGTFCELGLSNIQMGVRLNRSPSTISYELSRCQPYQAELAQTDAEYINLVPKLFPKAKVFVDRFHIVQMMNRSLNSTRIQVMK